MNRYRILASFVVAAWLCCAFQAGRYCKYRELTAGRPVAVAAWRDREADLEALNERTDTFWRNLHHVEWDEAQCWSKARRVANARSLGLPVMYYAED